MVFPHESGNVDMLKKVKGSNCRINENPIIEPSTCAMSTLFFYQSLVVLSQHISE